VAIPGVGTVPLSGEIHQLAREIVDTFRYRANARERRRGDGLSDAICAEDRNVQPDFGHTCKSGLDVGG
jgi:hypothetical protein